MVLSNTKKTSHISSITNLANCGGNKKAGLMGNIGGVGIGGMSGSRHSKAFCCSARGSHSFNMMNTSIYGKTCSGAYSGNFSNPSQVAAKRARRGMV